MDGPAPGGTYRIKITIRFKVRRSERFVEKKGPTKRFRGWVYSKKAGVLSIDFSLNYFSLDRGIIGCPLNWIILRMSKAPKIEIYLVKSREKARGVGELGVPPHGPCRWKCLHQRHGHPPLASAYESRKRIGSAAKERSLKKGGRFPAAPLAPPGLALEEQTKRRS